MIVQRLDAQADRFDRIGKIGVGEDDQVAPGGQHAPAHGRSLAAVLPIADQPDGVALRQIAPHQRGAVVMAAVVGDDDLVAQALLAQIGVQQRDGVD